MILWLHFTSARFDVTTEPPNRYNPIAGHSLLVWLRPRLQAMGYAVDEPGCEDWGWYVEVSGPGRRYLVGTSAVPDTDGTADWSIRLWRTRSFREWIQRKGQLTRNDPMASILERLVREEVGDATDVEILEA